MACLFIISLMDTCFYFLTCMSEGEENIYLLVFKGKKILIFSLGKYLGAKLQLK